MRTAASETTLPHGVIALLASYRFDLSREDTLQQQMAEVFASHGIGFQREVTLSAGDRIDFLIEGGLGVEVKINGSPAAIHRQCKRYCLSEKINSLLLVTGRSMGLPEHIEGKPCHVHMLGRSWL